MSHIHLPDGVLPIWLWVSGFIGAILVGVILFRLHKQEDLSRRLPLLGMMAAVMVLGASVEIVPIAYHVNLTVVSGILLGPSLVFSCHLRGQCDPSSFRPWGDHGHWAQYPYPFYRRGPRIFSLPPFLEGIEKIRHRHFFGYLFCPFRVNPVYDRSGQPGDLPL